MQNGGPGYPQWLTFTDTYSYDNVNRLTAATDSGGWTRNFGYDPFGNMWVTTPASQQGVALSGLTPTSDVYTSANRTSTGSYDAAGNQSSIGGASATYDAENRQVLMVDPQWLRGEESYTYDGNGKRSPDPANAGADPSDPQTWNAYAYVRNNPMNGVDPAGREKMALTDPLESDLWSGIGVNSGGLSSLCGTAGLCEPGGGLSFLYSPGLNDLSNASEQQYAQGANSTFYGNLANQYAQSGDVTAAKQVAALSGGSVSVSDIKNTINYTNDAGAVIGTQSFERVTVTAAAAATVGCVLAEPCGIGELLLGGAAVAAGLSEALAPMQYNVPPKTLPGFPGSVKVPAKGKRATWKLPDGKIAEWDYQHGKVEVYNPRGNQHLGEFDPQTGEQTGPPEPGRKAQQ